MKNTAAVLWTGGKDCALAFFKAQQANYTITHLVTFTPKKTNFKAHPIELIKKQVKAINIPHLLLTVEAPIQQSYENAIQQLKDTYNIETIITGDIDEITGHEGNWIEKCSKKSGMKVYNPLWKKNRSFLLNELEKNNFKVIFSLVKKPYFDKQWVGTLINKIALINLKNQFDIDICGENGEYHTMVLYAPYFEHEIVIKTKEVKESKHHYYINLQL